MNIKNLLKQLKKEDKTSVKLNSSLEVLTQELKFIVLSELTPLTVDTALQSTVVVNLVNPEWGCKRIQRESQGAWFEIGTGSNTKCVGDDEIHFWASVNNLPYGLDWTEIF